MASTKQQQAVSNTPDWRETDAMKALLVSRCGATEALVSPGLHGTAAGLAWNHMQ